MLALAPGIQTVVHHGGTDMFLLIGGFILLVAFATVVAGGVLIGHRALGVISRKGKLEALKVDVAIEKQQHELRILTHTHGLHVLQLTEGDSTKGAEGKAGPPPEEPAEEVRGEVAGLAPYPRAEWEERRRLQQLATDAEIVS